MIRYAIIMTLSIIFVFTCCAHAKKIDVDICESTLVEYHKFRQLNADSYRDDFESFAAKYINELKDCRGPQQYRFGLREILNDPRSSEPIYSMIIDYFNSTFPSEEYGRNRNVWTNEIHIMARHNPLDDKTKLKLYEMAEKRGVNVVALAYITSGIDDISEELYARIVDDYVYKKPFSERDGCIYEKLFYNTKKRPLSERVYGKLEEYVEKSNMLKMAKINERKKNGRGPLHSMAEKKALWKRKKANEQIKIKNIMLYGKIVDQYGEPLPGVIIQYDGIHGHYAGGSGRSETMTDSEGCFNTKGAKGIGLMVHGFVKPGYEFNKIYHFDNVKHNEATLLWEDYSKKNPYVFKAWKIEK